jgi:hypothetical protein
MNPAIRALFEQQYRANSKSSVFIVNDQLLTGADGQYFHKHVREQFDAFAANQAAVPNAGAQE